MSVREIKLNSLLEKGSYIKAIKHLIDVYANNSLEKDDPVGSIHDNHIKN